MHAYRKVSPLRLLKLLLSCCWYIFRFLLFFCCILGFFSWVFFKKLCFLCFSKFLQRLFPSFFKMGSFVRLWLTRFFVCMIISGVLLRGFSSFQLKMEDVSFPFTLLLASLCFSRICSTKNGIFIVHCFGQVLPCFLFPFCWKLKPFFTCLLYEF